MTELNVILELSHSKRLENTAVAAIAGEEVALDAAAPPKLTTVKFDEGFPVVALPKVIQRDHPEDELYDMTAAVDFDAKLESSTYLVRGTVEDGALDEFEEEARKTKAVVSYYMDPKIQPMIVCPGDPPMGTDSTVEQLLCTRVLHKRGITGKGVLVAIVDTGFNMAYLNSQGKTPSFDPARSWAWDPAAVTPGSAPVDHGTMCAFDVCIAAPQCTLLDIALLHPLAAPPGGTVMQALLSDAILAYRHLLNILSGPRRPGEHRSLVVNNSWGMFHPSWDFPVGHIGNYSDNPNHPFNRIVATLERAGADILFAAGNCGKDCPDGRCGGVTTMAIYGANSSPHVTCVAGVDTTKARVGYSAIGPGRLEKRKPDICGYTHFSGSGVYTADGGTSAACPVVSGVVAALRTKRPFNPSDSQTSPAAIRNLITSTAEDLGPTGYDYQYGYGVVNPCKVADKLDPRPGPIIDLCKLFPWICRWGWWWRYFRRIPSSGSEMVIPASKIPPETDIDAEVAAEDTMRHDEVETLLRLVMPDVLDSDLSPEQIANRLALRLGKWEDNPEGACCTKG